MNPSQFVLSLIHASGGMVSGRTLLQKRGYFVSLLSRLPINLGYQAHYYGPYSSILDGTLTQMKNLGFIEEGTTGFGVISGGFEMRRYDYSLTEDGRKVLQPFLESDDYKAVASAMQKIQDAGNPDYIELSISAKAYYILRRQEKPMAAAELLKEAEKFNWNIPEPSLRRAIDFLQKVGLAKA